MKKENKTMKEGSVFKFSGCVVKFDVVICHKWNAETFAATKAKAISNFKYRIKKENGLLMQTPLELVGTISAN